MATDIVQPMRFEIDIKNGLMQTPTRMQLMKGDKSANRIIVALKDDEKDVDLTGIAVSGSFISPVEGAEIPLAGSASGNEASVMLTDECYAADGHFEINIKLTLGSTARTILSITGRVLSRGSGAYIDLEGVIPSIDDILAQYATMQEVTQDAQNAAAAADAAAANAPKVVNGTWYAWSAEKGEYIDTGVAATGPTGPQGPKGDGLYAFNVNENGHLICTYDTGNPPPLSIDSRGHLIYTMDGGKQVDLGKVTGEVMDHIETDDTLTYENGILSVNTASEVTEDNTLPITSAAVHTTVGNIEILLATI